MSNTVTKKYVLPYVITHMIGLSKIEDTSFWKQKKGVKVHQKVKWAIFYFLKYGHKNLGNGSLPGNEPFARFLCPYFKK